MSFVFVPAVHCQILIHLFKKFKFRHVCWIQRLNYWFSATGPLVWANAYATVAYSKSESLNLTILKVKVQFVLKLKWGCPQRGLHCCEVCYFCQVHCEEVMERIEPCSESPLLGGFTHRIKKNTGFHETMRLQYTSTGWITCPVLVAFLFLLANCCFCTLCICCVVWTAYIIDRLKWKGSRYILLQILWVCTLW